MQHKKRTPTLAAYIAFRNGDITFREYMTILLVRCAIVRKESEGVRSSRANHRYRRSLAKPMGGGDETGDRGSEGRQQTGGDLVVGDGPAGCRDSKDSGEVSEGEKES